jgi:hypothetical protein
MSQLTNQFMSQRVTWWSFSSLAPKATLPVHVTFRGIATPLKYCSELKSGQLRSSDPLDPVLNTELRVQKTLFKKLH